MMTIATQYLLILMLVLMRVSFLGQGFKHCLRHFFLPSLLDFIIILEVKHYYLNFINEETRLKEVKSFG
jgi:hypothetical protein